MNTLYHLRLEIKKKTRSQDVLFVFNAIATVRPEEFGTALEDEIEANLVPDQLVLVVRAPSFGETLAALKKNPQLQTALARLSDRTEVTLIGYGENGEEACRETVLGAESKPRVELIDIRRRAITSIFTERRGFVEATSTYHFENPSGRHTNRFIRVSNILARGAEIAFIAFCVLPFVPAGARFAYIDTPALFTVIAAINEQRRSFGQEGLLGDNFSSYAGFNEFVFDSLGESFALISASSSGALGKDLIEAKGFDPQRVVHLLFLGEGPEKHRVICDLQPSENDNPNGVGRGTVSRSTECTECRNGSHAIKLQGDQFDFAGPQHESLLVTINDKPPGLDKMMERLANTGAFAVGLGANTKPPRQYEISPTDLLNAEPFGQRLDYAVRRSIPASTQHIVAADGQSEPFANWVKEKIVPNAIVVRRQEIDAKLGDKVTSAVVVVAMVIESGRTLLDLSRDLRAVVPKAPISYLVGMSKTTGLDGRVALTNSLKRTHNDYQYEFLAVEEIILPTSSGHTAWASELKLLQRVTQGELPSSIRGLVEARRDRLAKFSEPLIDDLFLGNAADRKLKLQPGFVFWPPALPKQPHTQADVYFTMSSVLQQLRANAGKLGKVAIRTNWFQQTLLAPANFGRFNDDLIQASILRAANPAELNYRDNHADSREMGRLIARIVAAADLDRGGAAAEFLLAMANRRLQLRREDQEAVLNADVPNLDLVSFLQMVCRRELQED